MWGFPVCVCEASLRKKFASETFAIYIYVDLVKVHLLHVSSKELDEHLQYTKVWSMTGLSDNLHQPTQLQLPRTAAVLSE